MSLKQDLKRDFRNIKGDVAEAYKKSWFVTFGQHTIVIHNAMMHEKLYVDEALIAENVRSSIWSHIMPYVTLKGSFQSVDGKEHNIYVKLGGYFTFRIVVKIDGKKIFEDVLKMDLNPWEHKEKILSYIEMQATCGQVDGTLPDDVLLYDANHPQVAPGIADQMATEPVMPLYTKKLVKLFLQQVENPTVKTRKATYEKLLQEPVIAYFPELLELLVQAQYDEEKLQQEAIWLLENAAHREVLKFAVAVLAFTKCEEYKEKLQLIASHEEFTGITLFALRNGVGYSNEFVWQLVQTLNGWGKVAALDFLEAHTAEMKYWLLTEGSKSSVLPDYIAMLCAEKGKLDVALHEKQIEPAIFEGANLIIRQLLFDGNTERLDSYSYAGQVLARFMYHAKQHATTIEHYYTIAFIADYMDKDEALWQQLYDQSWKPHERQKVNEAIQYFKQQPLWKERVAEIIHSDELENEQALKVAQFYGLDVAPIVFEKLQREGDRVHYYEAILETENQQAIEQLCTLACKHFATLPLTELKEFCVLTILYNLEPYEGVGIPLLRHCLQSEWEQFQLHALEVLNYWSKENYVTSGIIQDVNTLQTRTKNKEIKQLAKQLIKE